MTVYIVRTEKFEDVDLNSAIQPFLVAERDRNWLRLLKKNRDLEDKVCLGYYCEVGSIYIIISKRI